MLFANQAGDGLELPPLDVFVKATGAIYNFAVVNFDASDPNIEYDVRNGRVLMTGVELARDVGGSRSADVHGVAFDYSKPENTQIAAAGDRVRVRVIGATKVLVRHAGAINKGDKLTATATSGCMAPPADNSSDGAAATQGFRIGAFALEAATLSSGSGTVLNAPTMKVAFNGFGWGHDEYTED